MFEGSEIDEIKNLFSKKQLDAVGLEDCVLSYIADWD